MRDSKTPRVRHIPPRALFAAAVLVGAQLASAGTAFAQEPINADLTALLVAGNGLTVPSATTTVSGSESRQGTKEWDLFLGNRSQMPATDGSTTVTSGYSPSRFSWNGPVSSLPRTMSMQGSISDPPWSPGPLLSDIPVEFHLGYDSTRSVTPETIPVAGGQQTVTITVTPTDPRYVAPPNGIGFTWFNLILESPVSTTTLISVTDPDNLDEGEQLQVQPPGAMGLIHWRLGWPMLNKTYTFTAVINVPNSGDPFQHIPRVSIRGERQMILCRACAGPTVNISEPTLDGDAPGSGTATFTVNETAHTWTSTRSEAFDLFYEGSTAPQDATQVTIVVKPGSEQPAPVNPRSKGKTPVAILSSGMFDVRTIDPATVRFGTTTTMAQAMKPSFEDVNADGREDMVAHFETQDTGIICGTTTVVLTGTTVNGQPIKGSVPIKTVGCTA